VNPSRVSIPSFPITAAKVAMFLQHKSTHEKVSFKAFGTHITPCILLT
jgi:hypothetical protein